MTAPLSTVEAFIAEWSWMCGPATFTPSHDNEPCPVLIVRAEDVWDARLWAAKFGANDRHEVRWTDKTHGQRVREWFCAWQGWHVQIIGREQLTVPADITRTLTLVGAS